MLEILLWILLSITLVGGMPLDCWLDEKAREKDWEEFKKEIGHLPTKTQIILWRAKLRYDSERDLF